MSHWSTDLKIAMGEKLYTVEAMQCGRFAVHKAINSDGDELDYYTLTHILSGRAIMQGFYAFGDAFALGRKLSAMHIEWDTITERVTGNNYRKWITDYQYDKLVKLLREYSHKTGLYEHTPIRFE